MANFKLFALVALALVALSNADPSQGIFDSGSCTRNCFYTPPSKN